MTLHIRCELLALFHFDMSECLSPEIALLAEISRYPNICIAQIRSKPDPDLRDPVIFCSTSGKQVAMSGQAVFSLNLVLLRFPNI